MSGLRGPSARLLLAWALLGCGSTELTIPLPLEPETKSVVLALEHEGELAVFAIDAVVEEGGRRFPLQRVLSSDADLALTALLYDVPLDRLDLAAGEIPRAAAGEETRPLPDAGGRYRAVLSGDELSEWATIAALEGELASFRIRAPVRETACDGITATTVLFADEGLGFARAGVMGRELAYATKGRPGRTLHAITREGGQTIGVPGWSSTFDLAADHRGNLWVSDFGGMIARLDAGGAVLATVPVPILDGAVLSQTTGGGVIAYDATRAYALTESSTVATLAVTFPVPIVRAVFASTERALAVTQTQMWVLDGGEWRVEHEAEGLGVSFLFGDDEVLGFVHPSYGVLVRDERRRRFEPLPDPAVGAPLFGGRPLGSGRLLITGDGGIARIWDGREWCNLVTGTLRLLQSIDYAPELGVAVLLSYDINPNQVAVWLDLP